MKLPLRLPLVYACECVLCIYLRALRVAENVPRIFILILVVDTSRCCCCCALPLPCSLLARVGPSSSCRLFSHARNYSFPRVRVRYRYRRDVREGERGNEDG